MEILYLVALHSLGFTHKDLHRIFSENKNYKAVYDGISTSSLTELGITDNRHTGILERYEKLQLSALEKKLERLKVDIITYFDTAYPEQLKNIFHPPYLLYVRGSLATNALAFVGSRKISDYGKQCIEKVVPEVGKYFAIVSGGAYGCDSEAHKAALKHGIKTVSVFGTGIDICYPAQNKAMFEKILTEGGALVSSFPLGTPGSRFNFPVRNEIVAGLSVGVVVVEAQHESGSLITANLALDLGKDLYAFPGSIFSKNSEGCNELIKNGAAKAVLSPLEILEEYDIASSVKKEAITLSDPLQQQIYDKLTLGKKTMDELHELLGGSFQELTLALSMMELAGVIKKSMDGGFILS